MITVFAVEIVHNLA